MILLTLVAALLAALLYAFAATAALRQLAGHAHPGRMVLPLAAGAMLCHLGYLALALPGSHGADFTVLKTAVTAALLIVLLLSSLHWRRSLLPLLAPTYLFTTLLLVMTALIPEHSFYQLGHKPSMVVHISLALAAYALFMVCALLALLVASIQHRLKQRRFNLAPGYPSLVGVEQLLQQLLGLGVIILAAAVVTGFLFLEGFWGQGQAHKAILTSAALLFYIGLWWRQKQSGVRGRHLVFAHLLGATLLSLAYFGSRLIRELLLAHA